MTDTSALGIFATRYDRKLCQIGVVHLGFGGFHRSHQAVYLDDYMDTSGDLRWGIAAVNLRPNEAEGFKAVEGDILRHDGYFLKSHSANGAVALRRVRSHIRFAGWSESKKNALEGVETFDAAMRVPHLAEHFQNFENKEVLPAITLSLPFSKSDYLNAVTQRFGNAAIGDTVARICADGMAKFPTFIRPTIEGCFQQGIVPVFAIRSIASWYVFAQHVDAGNITFDYFEPAWEELKAMLGEDSFITDSQLWGELPTNYPEFAEVLKREIAEMESKWPV